jgi:hypothetical protein
VPKNDAQKVIEVGRRIRSGNVGQNGIRGDILLAFGGFKMSGMGREGGPEGIAPSTWTKTILVEQASARARVIHLAVRAVPVGPAQIERWNRFSRARRTANLEWPADAEVSGNPSDRPAPRVRSTTASPPSRRRRAW